MPLQRVLQTFSLSNFFPSFSLLRFLSYAYCEFINTLEPGNISSVLDSGEVDSRNITVNLFPGFGGGLAQCCYCEHPSAAGQHFSLFTARFCSGMEDQYIFIHRVQPGNRKTGLVITGISS